MLFSVAFPLAASADWPQYLGPDRTGVAKEKGLARTWPESGPKELWKITVGEGYAGAAVSKGEVFVLDRTEDKNDILRCLSLADGKELWNYSYVAEGKYGHNGSRTPPTVDDKYVYSVGLMGDLVCVDRATKKPVWQKNLIKDFNASSPNWGVGQSPLLYKKLVIVNAQGPETGVVAYDRVTGELVWKSPALGLPGYASPSVFTLGGVEQLVAMGASNRDKTELGSTVGISLEDGSVLWKYEGWQCWIPIPNPTLLPDDKLFITGGYGSGSAIIQVKKGASGFEVTEVKKLDADTCGSQIHQPIVYNDHIYINNNSNEKTNGMSCFTLDGTLKWKTADIETAPKFDRGSLIVADDLIIALDAKSGILYLVEPSPDGYKELAHAPTVEGRELFGPLALSDGKLLVRSQDTLKCLDLKKS
jgi:outer membrane protein assembly factor BamB